MIQAKNLSSTKPHSSRSFIELNNRVSGTNKLGYLIVRENFDWSADLSQYANYTLEIRHVFNLDTLNIVLPANVTLKFDGGQFVNFSTITGEYTRIEAELVRIFNSLGTLEGTWKVDRCYPEWFGAKGDGVTDDTIYVQQALNFTVTPCVFSGNTYVVSPLTLLSNTDIEMSLGTILLAKTGYIWSDRLLNIKDVSDINIRGNGGTIQMLKDEYTSGEDRHCVNISSANNVYIDNLIVKDSGGDGFYVGGDQDAPSRNITISNCISDNNRRQGLSITNVIDCWILGGTYKNTVGIAPQSGIDVEPNPLSGYYIQNVNIVGVKTYNNKGSGILITPYELTNTMTLNVIDCISENDGKRFGGGMIIANSLGNSKTTGSINIDNLKIINPAASGLTIAGWNQNSPNLVLNNLYILNPGNDPIEAAVSTLNRHAIYIASSGTNDDTVTTGHIKINGCKIEDNRSPVVTYSPINLYNTTIYPTSKIEINKLDITYKQWEEASDIPLVYTDVNDWSSIKLDYINDVVIEAESFTLSKRYINTKLTAVFESGFTLPLASTVDGCEFEFFQKNTGYVVIYPNVADSILGYTNTGIGLTTRTVGSRIRLRSYQDNWEVVFITGNWGVHTYYGEKTPQSATSVAPTTGTWEWGDKIYNKYPVYGGTIGWICLSGGTPGIWWPFGTTGIDIVQTLSGTTPAWNTLLGKNAKITLTGATTITMSNLAAGQRGTLVVTNGNDVGFLITFAGYTFKILNTIRNAANKVTVSGGTTIDVYHWHYDGTVVCIDGGLNYN